ncbi:ras-like protein RAS2 [Drosophila albomicans]|uniref:Ras-like protein RAS2 n=1 Tax=Drosophila albomicans TaxID=7291 RepID=A0A9C6TAD0_DROAB|nr:ras-like protein RAS2 [Drosophila albomicans]
MSQNNKSMLKILLLGDEFVGKSCLVHRYVYGGYSEKNLNEFPVALVGTKIDLENEREVSTQEAQKWCDDLLIPYFECSAQDGTNVKAAFHALLLRVMNSRT